MSWAKGNSLVNELLGSSRERELLGGGI
jgi:hypothetical protein